MAAKLGKPFMPWQQYVADVLGEIDPDPDPRTGRDRLFYDEGDITVPRQSGKTTFKLAKATHRCTATGFFGARQHLVYTAQTRNKAREKFEEEFAPDLLAPGSAFRTRVRAVWGNGNEHLRFQNGSRFGIEATTEKAGHGGVIDEAYIDEAFAQVDDRLEQAFDPAMITRLSKQLLVVSTAGWLDASPYLLGKVKVGRDQIESGQRTRTAYFEWSAPDDADIEDPAVWWACMPALGFTVTEDAIRSQLDKALRNGKVNGFRRAYLNQWVLKEAAAEAVIDAESWSALTSKSPDRPSPVAFSVVVSDDRKWASIGLAGRRTDGRSHVQIVQAGRGTRWVVERLVELNADWSPTGIAVVPSSPAGSLIGAMEEAGLPLVKVGTDQSQACGLFVDAVEEGTVAHTNQPQIAVAIGAADTRKVGQAWVWKAKDDTDISPLWAVTLALHALGKQPTGTRKKKAGVYW